MQPAPPARVRIALYCHNRDGLGHIVRSIRLAESLEATGLFEPILLTGCRRLDALAIPPRIAVHRITPIPSDLFDPQQYHVLAQRAREIKSFMNEYRPDVLLVDTLPLGYRNELREVLQRAAQDEDGPLCFLGLPYPVAGLSDLFKNGQSRAALAAYRYGLVYSDEDHPVYQSFSFPLAKLGIVAGPPPPAPDPSSKTIVALGGGGTVSYAMLQPLIKATEAARGAGYTVRFISGPLAGNEKLQSEIGDSKGFELVPVGTVEEALADACLVISRCGYNTAATLVRSSLPLIFLPFGEDENDEQFVRARQLAQLKNIIFIDTLKEDVEVALKRAVDAMIDCPLQERAASLSFDGAERAAQFLVNIVPQLKKERTLVKSPD